MEEALPLVVGVVSFVKDLFGDDNNRNNDFQDQLDNISASFNMRMEQDRLETEQKIKLIQEESSRNIKEICDKYEKDKIIRDYRINELEKNSKNDIKNLENQIKEKDEEIKNKFNSIKLKRKKDKERFDKIEKDILEMKNKSIINQNENEKQKLGNEKLSDQIKLFEQQNIKYQQELDTLLINQKNNSKKILNEQESEMAEMNRRNNNFIAEIEEQKARNQTEIDSLSAKYNEDIISRKKKLDDFEKEKKDEEHKKQEEEKIQELKDKKNADLAENKFQNKSKIIINQFIEKLKNEISEKNFFDEILNEYNTTEISKIIEDIFAQINLKQIFDVKTKKFLNIAETLKLTSEMSHLNILLLGPTGSGKSTLINVLLELEGQERAEVGDDNNPKTMDFHAYTSNKKKYIRCYDSRGIEKNKNYSLDKFIENSKNLILKKLEENNPDEFIHIILYCFEGCKFIEEVRDSLYKLMDLYNDETLPIILVHTRGVQGEDDELLDMIRTTLKKEKRKIDLINICAEKDDDFPAFGIDDLNKLMINKVKESVKSACFSSVQNKVKDNFLKVNINYKNNYKKEFEKIVNSEMKNITLNSNIDEQRKKYLKIFCEDIFEKILYESKKSLNQNCKNILENYLNYFFKWILEKSEKYMIDYISKTSFELISDLLKIQHSINAKYDNKLQIQKNTEEWKEEMDKKLKQKLDNIILFKLMKEGSIFIYEEFNDKLLDKLEKRYKKYLQEENEFITQVTKNKVETIINNFVFN